MGPGTHRHIPRGGSSGPRPLSLRGPAPHSEGVQHPGDSVGSGSHGSAGPPGRCGGRSPPLRLAGAGVEGQVSAHPGGHSHSPTPRPRSREGMASFQMRSSRKRPRGGTSREWGPPSPSPQPSWGLGWAEREPEGQGLTSRDTCISAWSVLRPPGTQMCGLTETQAPLTHRFCRSIRHLSNVHTVSQHHVPHTQMSEAHTRTQTCAHTVPCRYPDTDMHADTAMSPHSGHHTKPSD